MLVVVKKLPIEFRVEGTIPCELIDSLRRKYGEAIHVEDDGACVPVHEMAWYKDLASEDSPGKRLRFYRTMHDLTQVQLAERLGVAKQFVSDMERDRKPISRRMAKQLASFFSVDAGRFI